MSIYAIGDLHLSFSTDKPMDVFGKEWNNYEEKLIEKWNLMIKEDDLVILPGDFSWAMYLEETEKDFEYLSKLPGKKIIVKGNHDYWWTTIKKMNSFLEEKNLNNIDFIFNNAKRYKNYIIVGTRGWYFGEDEECEKMLNREILRLENSIKCGLNLMGDDNLEIICAMHYPPITKNMIESNKKSPYLELMKKYNIERCIYGHLHGQAHSEAVEGIVDGVKLKLVSSDYLKFEPYLIEK